MDKFFAALVAILDEALACRGLLPSQVQSFEMYHMPDGGVWVGLDDTYYVWVDLPA